jgi:hypothetical protein
MILCRICYPTTVYKVDGVPYMFLKSLRIEKPSVYDDASFLILENGAMFSV